MLASANASVKRLEKGVDEACEERRCLQEEHERACGRLRGDIIELDEGLRQARATRDMVEAQRNEDRLSFEASSATTARNLEQVREQCARANEDCAKLRADRDAERESSKAATEALSRSLREKTEQARSAEELLGILQAGHDELQQDQLQIALKCTAMQAAQQHTQQKVHTVAVQSVLFITDVARELHERLRSQETAEEQVMLVSAKNSELEAKVMGATSLIQELSDTITQLNAERQSIANDFDYSMRESEICMRDLNSQCFDLQDLHATDREMCDLLEHQLDMSKRDLVACTQSLKDQERQLASAEQDVEQLQDT